MEQQLSQQRIKRKKKEDKGAKSKKGTEKKAEPKKTEKKSTTEKKTTTSTKGSKKPEEKTEVVKEKSAKQLARFAKRNSSRVLDPALADQFKTGRVYAKISSRPGQSGRCDGYLLEGDELHFYLKKLNIKKKK